MPKSLPAIGLLFLVACGGPKTGTLRPELAFTISGEIGLTAARDLTVDSSGNIFVFDYDDYVISKFSPSGESLSAFGGNEELEGRFEHLMAIRALGDSLLTLDAGALSVFDPTGQLLSHKPFSDTITCDLPRLHSSGQWAGQWIFDETAEKILTLRDADGREHSRVARHDLGEFFPGVEPGGFFFLNGTQDRSYYYDFFQDGRLVWAASDGVSVFVRDDQEDVALFSLEASPLPFPSDRTEEMRETQSSLGPPLFMNVPEYYQLVQHLLVDETGNIWIYLMSQERTGFLHLSSQGRELGFYEVEADFDMLSARVTAARGSLYFLLAGRDATEIYVVDRPS